MRAINVLLAIVVSLAFFFGVFEAGLRLFPAFRPQETINQFDSKLGWTKEPGRSVTRSTSEFKVTFDINELGLRDDPMTTAEKPAGTFRVVTLGDSFVLGFTVDRENLFVDHLETWWGEEQRRVDVLNAGTDGYSTDQEVVWFLEHGADYDPDLVLLFPYENDIYWNSQSDYHGKAKPRFSPDGTVETGTLANNSPNKSFLSKLALVQFLEKSIKPLIQRRGAGPHDFQVSGTDVTLPREFAVLLNESPAFVEESLERTRGALTALRNHCDELSAKLVMVPIPSESAIHGSEREKFAKNPMGGLPADAWSPDRPVDLFLELGGELGITTLDPRARLKTAAEEEGELLYFSDEWHFNPLGNQVFAKYLHAELGALGVFPEDHGPLAQSTLEAPDSGDGPPFWISLFVGLWIGLGTTFMLTYRDEPAPLAFAKVGGLLAFVFTVILGGGWLARQLPPDLAPYLLPAFVVIVLGFVAYKLGRRLGTIMELIQAFTLRGHWYLMPLVVVLLTIGSLLVVAASSPLIAPFIYTLF